MGVFGMTNQEKTMDKIVALCKGRGFIYAGSEIYGGLARNGPRITRWTSTWRP